MPRRRSYLVVLAVITGCGLLYGQSAPLVSVSPASATMLVGESRRFRAVDGNGHALRNVDWAVFEPGIVEVSSGDEVVVTAHRVGNVTLRAHAGDGSGDAHIEVADGRSLPQGTVIWSSGDVPGCRTTKIMPAVPVANGPDVFEQSECPDGTYIRAYTSDGVLLWRRKIGSKPSALAKSAGKSEAPTMISNSFNIKAGSICDSISVGMKEDGVRDLLRARNLPAPATATGQKTWVIEEEGAQCKLWFDSASGVVKKRKTLTTE